MASHVLHRFLVPRHPPCALKNLATDARVHCAVLKQRPATHHPTFNRRVHWGRRLRKFIPSDTQQRARHTPRSPQRSTLRRAVLEGEDDQVCRIVNVPPMSNQHQTFADVLASEPIVASHVLHRFLVPRHPPCALKNLATDARVHCAVLKQRPATRHTPLP